MFNASMATYLASDTGNEADFHPQNLSQVNACLLADYKRRSVHLGIRRVGRARIWQQYQW